MKTIVYADMLFIINFIINIIILKITTVFSKAKPSTLRMVSAASLGALYALFMFFPKIDFLYIFPAKLAVSLVMIKITLPKSPFLKLCKLCAMFYLVSFAFAGILLALVYFTDFASGSGPVVSNGIFYFNISLKKLNFNICNCVRPDKNCIGCFFEEQNDGNKKHKDFFQLQRMLAERPVRHR